ncbi:MAG: DUF4111 domain-containing protein [Actinomycetota bacterium]|nr:DUF4111 domain-containing protein [Actinomycetota bacterium]
MAAELPTSAAIAVEAYLGSLDRHPNHGVDGVYVCGSIALGAFEEGRSDVDLVAVGEAAPDITTIEAIGREVDAAVAGPPLSTLYVEARQLAGPAAGLVDVPFWNGGELELSTTAANPVEWHVLAHHGIALRGPAPSTLDVHLDRGDLVAWNLANLDSYWAGLAEMIETADDERNARAGAGFVEWMVLGPPRLHRTIAIGDVVSKRAAGLYARERFGDRWAALIDEALALRTDDAARAADQPSAARTREVAAFMRLVIADAHAVAGADAGR